MGSRDPLDDLWETFKLAGIILGLVFFAICVLAFIEGMHG